MSLSSLVITFWLAISPAAAWNQIDRKLTHPKQTVNQETAAFVTLYAASLGQVAYEYKDKHQGYFTWALVEGLKGAAANNKGEVTPYNLVRYVQNKVPAQVQDLGGGVTLELVKIPPGTFLMGTSQVDVKQVTEHYQDPFTKEEERVRVTRWLSRETPQHTVTVSPFFMGKFEVTQAQWRAVARLPKVDLELNPEPSYFKGDTLPVEQVSWDDAMEFCTRLSRATGRAYRLPSEAEWEYACRAGSATQFNFGDTITAALVNYNGRSPYGSAPNGEHRDKTWPVGSSGVANAFGLYDMHGNVWEWCLDSWHKNYSSAPTNGQVWEGGDKTFRAMRGGSWYNTAVLNRSASRNPVPRVARSYVFGFRVVVGE